MLLTEVKTDKLIDYHKELNPKIWENDKLKPDVKHALGKIHEKFIEFLKVDSDHIKDIVLTGSICNYNYTKYSDIDLHLIVDYDAVCDSCEDFDLDDCMKAKKTLWNEQHEITIHGHEVEIYVQSEDEKVLSTAGTYSLTTNKWVNKPTKQNVEYDLDIINFKADKIMQQIDYIEDNEAYDLDEIEALKKKIWNGRKAGLEKDGELSLENLVFKTLRNAGYLDKLRDISTKREDNSLSID